MRPERGGPDPPKRRSADPRRQGTKPAVLDPRLPWSDGAKIIAAFAVIYLVWGSTFLAIRIGVQELPPLLFAAGRFVIAGSLLAGVALTLRERFPRASREWVHAGMFSVLMIPLSNGLSTVALRHVPSNEGALLAAGSALWLAGLGAIGPRGHKLSARSITGLLLGFAGVVLLAWPRKTATADYLGWRALMLTSSLSFAIASIVYRDAKLSVGPIAFNAIVMLLGASVLAIAGVVAGEPPHWHWSRLGVASMLYLAVFGSALAYTAYTWLLKRAPADRVGTFAYVNPAIATVLGWAVLGEALTRAQLLGVLVILAGVALVTLPSGR
jgi:drug/metabolite transporter (DMT)-like permease